MTTFSYICCLVKLVWGGVSRGNSEVMTSVFLKQLCYSLPIKWWSNSPYFLITVIIEVPMKSTHAKTNHKDLSLHVSVQPWNLNVVCKCRKLVSDSVLLISEESYYPLIVVTENLQIPCNHGLLVHCGWSDACRSNVTYFPDSKYGFQLQLCSEKAEVSGWVTQWMQKRKSEFIESMPLYVCSNCLTACLCFGRHIYAKFGDEWLSVT